jgi:hypothetical protein
MPRHARWLTLGGALLLALLAGCGNEQKGELYLALDAATQHPEVSEASARWLLAETLAAMQLTVPQAKALKDWAETDGAKVRGDLDESLAKAGHQAAETRQAADEVLGADAGTYAERADIARRHHLNPKDPMLFNEDLTPGGKPKTELLSAEALIHMRPIVETLSEEQRCIAGGGWLDALRAVAELQTATDAAAKPQRAELVNKMKGIWIMPQFMMPDDDKKLRAAVDKIDAGLTQPSAPEAALRQLTSVMPPMAKAVQIEVAAKALGALLSLDIAPDILKAIR